MKLAKALKEKNRLIGLINHYKTIISRENVKTTDNKPKVNLDDIWAELDTTVSKLIKIKSAIFKANSVIYDKILLLGELKEKIKFISTLNTTNGVTRLNDYSINGNIQTIEYVAHLTQEEVDRLTIEIQNKISNIQDDIDMHNAITEIVI